MRTPRDHGCAREREGKTNSVYVEYNISKERERLGAMQRVCVRLKERERKGGKKSKSEYLCVDSVTRWANFESSRRQIFLQKCSKYLVTFWAILENITFKIKTSLDLFG